MAARLADRLSAARHGRFVGRAAELALFRSALSAPEPRFHVLFVFGPGGIGKTALLHELADLCAQTGIAAAHLDARNVEAAPPAFLAALATALGLKPKADPAEALASRASQTVVVIDTYEALAPLDSWFREVFLPQVPDNVLFVLASRGRPSSGWRADPGWQTLVSVLPLRNLSPDESRALLAQRAVPVSQHGAVLAFTHGHPLALSLVADVYAQRGELRFEPEANPDVLRALVERLVQEAPGPAHRAALEACAIVRLTTEASLAEMLRTPDAHELFEWLRDLSFIESGSLGLFPHDLAREALVTDLRWRNPDWYAELHHRARGYYAARLQRAHGYQQQQDILLDYIFLHRDNAVVRPFFDLLRGKPDEGEDPKGGGALADRAAPTDAPAMMAMVERHEGKAAASLASFWIERYPEAFLVFRDPQGEAAGFVAMVPLHNMATEDVPADPAVRATVEYLQRHAPLRSGERATLFRFWMARDTYQAVSSTQSLIFVHMVRHYLTTPGLAFTFLPCAEPDFWALLFAYADLTRIPEADFEVGERRYGMYGHDWRKVPPTAWLDLLADREIAATLPGQGAPQPLAEPVLVLSQPEFMAAIRDALREYTHPSTLRGNLLTRSRLVTEQAGSRAAAAERAATLQLLVREAAESLQASPREAKLYRALNRTYLRPAATQERAAEQLDLPFSTYRRHLTAGIARVAEILWQREIEGPLG